MDRFEIISARGGLVVAARCKLALGWGKEGDETGERRVVTGQADHGEDWGEDRSGRWQHNPRPGIMRVAQL
jgi:hypothetical protein